MVYLREMIYPAQTSFIPVQVALARFLESLGGLGINALSQNYPYWYLGVPFRYLSGPILAPFLAFLHRLLPSFSLFDIFFGLIGLSWIIGGLGAYLLVQALIDANLNADKRRMSVLAAAFYLFGPIVPFLFRFSDGASLISFSVVPYVLVLYLRFLRCETHGSERERRKSEVLLLLLISFLLLLDISILPVLVLSMAALFLARADWKKVEEKIKKSLWIMAYSILLVTLWYTPGYWLRILGAPSLAGKGIASVVSLIGQLLPVALAYTLAVLSVRFFKKKDPLRNFCFYFLFVFGFLTLMRFIADPDFWLDWSVYGTELQLGIAILLGLIVTQISNLKSQIFRLRLKTFSLLAGLFTFYFLLFIFIFNRYVLGTLQKDITKTVEYQIGRKLSQIAKTPPEGGQAGERVFLSGTTAFWLNSLSASWRIPQVRGGKDKVAPHPMWDRNVWEIRDGTRPERTLEALRELEVSYLVVHTEDSEEFYHDFSHPEKFEEINKLEKIYEEEGDIIYRVLD